MHLRRRWPGAALGDAVAAGDRQVRRGPVAATLAIGAVAMGAIAWRVAVFALVIPVADAEQSGREADDESAPQRFDAAAAATARGTPSARPLQRRLRLPRRPRLMLAGAAPQQVQAMLDIAIATDPASVDCYLTRAAYELRQPQPDVAAGPRRTTSGCSSSTRTTSPPDSTTRRLRNGSDRAPPSHSTGSAASWTACIADEPERLPPEQLGEIEGRSSG